MSAAPELAADEAPSRVRAPVDTRARGDVFRYEDFDFDPAESRLSCRYSLDGRWFTETVTFGRGSTQPSSAVLAAARLVFLTAGISYYKTAAPHSIDLGTHGLTAAERRFLHDFYSLGLGEYAYRNDMDLDFRIEARESEPDTVDYSPVSGRPLIPFGGGIDSIVTVDHIRGRTPDAALFVLSPSSQRFAAIERPAKTSGLPIVRAERTLDPQVLRSRESGFRNGHVPVTGILSAVAVLAAVLDGRDAVVMSNEHSASEPTLTVAGRDINHQYSKSWDFETGFATVLREALGAELGYFSLLRPYSELWVAKRFAALREYHDVFRSCNRAFHIDPAKRLDTWCGHCDKCCFVDLVLSPFVGAEELGVIFSGREPLRNDSLADQFRALLGLHPDRKPFECVGDISECRAAITLSADRPDRALHPLVLQLAAESASAGLAIRPDRLLEPMPPHAIPDEYAPDELLV